jgi:type IV pilus assembly protein PilM
LTFTGFLWNRSPAPLLGIDISSSSVKLVELGRQRDGQLVLERCALEPLAAGCITDGNVDQFDAVADALRRVVRHCGTRTRQAALALPSSAVITKKITVAGDLSETELAAQVEAEAGQYIPFSLEEVSLDFCITGPAGGDTGGREVLIAASRKERVQDRQGLAEAAGLRPVILDVESFASRLAATRLVEALPTDAADASGPMVALFELGAHSTGMQVLRGGEILYDRDQAFGGAQLTQQIARTYGLSQEEAEHRKRHGGLPPEYGPSLLRPFVRGMSQDIARALQFFFTSTPFHRVDGVLLAGGCAGLPGLVEAVSRQTSFDCRLADPFTGMRRGSAVDASGLPGQAPSYLTACGLALRRFLP